MSEKPSNEGFKGLEKAIEKTENIASFKKAKDKKGKDKNTAAYNYHWMTHLINHSEKRPIFFPEPFPEKYYLVQVDGSSKLILKLNETGALDAVKESALKNDLISYCDKNLLADPELHFDAKKAKDCVDYWIGATECIPEPKIFAFKSDSSLCYSRLPFDFDPDASLDSAPMFKELLSRMTNDRAFVLFMGSIFESASYLQQYLWLSGVGDDGKSSIGRLLKRCFKNAYASMQPPKGQDKFWTWRLVGKRVAVFPDCNSQTYVTGGEFKSLTGNDSVTVEQKRKDPFDIVLNTKYIFLSNEIPRISSEKADMKRVIFCEVKSFDGGVDATYDERLWLEAQQIISYCIKMYQKFAENSGHVPLPVDADSTEGLTDDQEEYLQVVFDDNFEITTDIREAVSAADFSAVIKRCFNGNKRDETAFRAFIRRKYKINGSKLIRDGGKVIKRYPGIKRLVPSLPLTRANAMWERS